MPVTADDGIQLHVEVEGLDGRLPATPPVTVVFSHGLALHQDSWHYQRRDLPARRDRMVFWDQRGHGRSGRGDGEHATIDQFGRTSAVIDAVAPKGPIVLVGHSMGGMTIMALAEQHPELFGERVVGVALVATSPGGLAEVTFGVRPPRAGRCGGWRPRHSRRSTGTPTLVDRSRPLGADLEFVLTKRYSYATDVPPSLVRFTSRMNDATPIDVIADLFPAFDAHDKLDALAVLNGVESLVLCGEQDLHDSGRPQPRDGRPACPVPSS